MTLAEPSRRRRPWCSALLDGVAAIGADPPGITRDAYGRGENEAQALIAAAGAALGLEARRDAGANLTLRWAGTDPDAPPMLIGSHLDSVVQGGNFDGAAGVIAGLATVAALQAAGIRPRMDIEVLALRCEEAVWFGLGLIGSRCLLARLPPGALDLPHARTGLTLAESIAACGGDPAKLAQCPLRDPARIGAYLEVHIEQAPQLVEAGAAGRHLPRQSRQYPPPLHPHHRRGCAYRPAAPLPPRCGAWPPPTWPCRWKPCGWRRKPRAARWPSPSAASTRRRTGTA